MKGKEGTSEELRDQYKKNSKGISKIKDITEYTKVDKFPSFTKNILDSSAVGFFILDADFKVAWINHAIEKYFGLQREKVIGRDKRQLIKNSIQSIFEAPDEFTRKVFATYDNNTYIENFECHVLSNGKRKDRWLEHWSQPIQSGAFAGGRIEHYYDISKRIEIERHLKSSEEYLKILFDHAPDAYYIHDLKGNFIDGNKQAEKIIGCKRENLIGKNFLKLKLLSSKDMPKAIKTLAKNVLGLSTGPDEYTLNRKNKSKVTVEISNHPIKIKGKTHVFGIARDITQRKQAEKILQEAEEKYHSLFENTGTATMVFEDDMTISLVNSQTEKLTGYSKNEIEDKMKWTAFVVPEDLERMKKYHLARRKAGEKPPTEYEFCMVDKNGKIKDVFIKIGMIPYAKKSIACLTDITKRKMTEDKLQKSEARLKEAQRIAHVGSWEYDIGTDVLHWSDEVYRIFNLKPQQCGATFEAFLNRIHPDDRVMVDKAYNESVKNKTPFDIIHRLLLKDGTLKFVRERCETFYDNAGKAIHSIGTVQDITKRQQAEEKLLHRVELEKLITSISSQFVGIDLDKLDDEISQMLKRVGQFTRVDHSFLFILSDDGTATSKTLEWCAPGIESHIDKLERISASKVPWLMKQLCYKKTVHIPKISDLPDQANTEKETLRAVFIKSLLMVPIHIGTRLVGFIGFDTIKTEKAWPTEDITLLKTLGNIMANILEHQQADERLKEYRFIVENAHDAIYSKDLKGRYTLVNRIASEIYGKSPEEIIGKSDLEIMIDEQETKSDIADDQIVFKKQKSVNVMKYMTGARGKSLWLQTIKVPHFDHEGKIKGLIGISRDVTKSKKSEETLRKTMDATIEAMSKIIEVKDPYTSGHQQRVSQLAVAIAKALNLSQEQTEGIKIAALIHDIGKIGIPTEILSKSTILSDIEFSLIQAHTQIGYDILKSIDFSYPIAQIVLQHHEKLNGSGYPKHLKGDEILLEAKIICVADVVEAMSSHRPYRPALGIVEALEEINKNKGVLYKPEVVDICSNLFKKKGFKFE